MKKKEFIARIDAIIWAETPEQQKKLINELYKNMCYESKSRK